MVRIAETVLTNFGNFLKNKFTDEFVRGSESALIVAWWDIVIVAVGTWILRTFLGPIMSQMWQMMHVTMANNTFWQPSDVSSFNNTYYIFGWIAPFTLICVIYYGINYSKLKKSGAI